MAVRLSGTGAVDRHEVDSLVYDELGEANEVNAHMHYRIALANVLTVEEAFEVIEEAHGEADWLRVAYHTRYGYPTEINIDYYANVADDEIRWTMSNLMP